MNKLNHKQLVKLHNWKSMGKVKTIWEYEHMKDWLGEIFILSCHTPCKLEYFQNGKLYVNNVTYQSLTMMSYLFENWRDNNICIIKTYMFREQVKTWNLRGEYSNNNNNNNRSSVLLKDMENWENKDFLIFKIWTQILQHMEKSGHLKPEQYDSWSTNLAGILPVSNVCITESLNSGRDSRSVW